MISGNRNIHILFIVGVVVGLAGVVLWRHDAKVDRNVSQPSGITEPTRTSAPLPAIPDANVKTVDTKQPISMPKDLVAVGQHVLIAFDESALGTLQKRSRGEAVALANKMADRLARGESAEKLVAEFSDDPMKSVDGGIRCVKTDTCSKKLDRPATPRAAIPAYADALFRLDIGDVTIVDYDADENDLGYIVIKRIE